MFGASQHWVSTGHTDHGEVVMTLSTTMKGYGRAARSRAGLMGHQMKDRAQQIQVEVRQAAANRRSELEQQLAMRRAPQKPDQP